MHVVRRRLLGIRIEFQAGVVNLTTSLTGGAHYLAKHLGKPETTVVGSDLYLAPVSPTQLQSVRGVPYPDLFIAFDADPAGYLARNGYVISEQGKPPDLVLEIASRSTGRRDTVDKRISYAALGIQEFWRFERNRTVPRHSPRRRPPRQRPIRTAAHRGTHRRQAPGLQRHPQPQPALDRRPTGLV